MMQRIFSLILVYGLTLVIGCSLQNTAATRGAQSPPLFEGMGDQHRTVTTTSPLAQRYFDQGLIWSCFSGGG